MTKEIQIAVGKQQVLAGHCPVVENVSYLLPFREMDVISWRSGKLYEFEIKISRSDFISDSKKKKNYYNGVKGPMVPPHNPNFFSYVCPEGLISEDEIPDFAGLYYFKDGKLSCIRKPKNYNRYQHDEVKVFRKAIRIFQERNFLGGCLLTYRNKEIERKRKERANGQTLLDILTTPNQ